MVRPMTRSGATLGTKGRAPAIGEATTRDPTQGPLAVPTRINEAFTYPIGNGCQYSATVRGSVKSARSASGEEPRYTPNLTVNAWVTCQNNTELRVTDNALRETAMTRSQLEQAIELRGSLLAESSGKRCVYVPDFNLGDGRLTGVGVSNLCPSSSAMGSGLADNQDGNGHTGDDTDSVAPSENRPAGDSRSHDGSRGTTITVRTTGAMIAATAVTTDAIARDRPRTTGSSFCTLEKPERY